MEGEREGADITAAHMVAPLLEPSQIREYYDGTTVFVTGATGFLGRLLVEKLLRTCDVRKIYILVRPKRGRTVQKRYQEYFDDPLYERLKWKHSDTLPKLHLIPGDCVLPGLGLSTQDRTRLISEVNCVFHCAATVRFDETLKKATDINVRATRDLIKLSQEVLNLQSLVYVSTAYSNCPTSKIEEVFYRPPITGDNLLKLVESLEDVILEKVTPILLGKWPNTYVYTKLVAENDVRTIGTKLPIAVVRPSMVMGTSKEPVAGWTDNFYGPTGVFVGIAVGVIRTIHCEPNNIADMVPADFVINCMLAAGWDIGTSRSTNQNLEVPDGPRPEVPIYNIVSGPKKSISWREHLTLGNHQAGLNPTVLQVWHSFFVSTANRHLYTFFHYVLHMFPAYVIQILAIAFGKDINLIKGYKRIEKVLKAVSYFSTGQWFFHDPNTRRLWEQMNVEDKKTFEFNMDALDWEPYYETSVKGGRVYLLKDPLETIPEAVSKRFRLKVVHYFVMAALVVGFYKMAGFWWRILN